MFILKRAKLNSKNSNANNSNNNNKYNNEKELILRSQWLYYETIEPSLSPITAVCVDQTFYQIKHTVQHSSTRFIRSNRQYKTVPRFIRSNTQYNTVPRFIRSNTQYNTVPRFIRSNTQYKTVRRIKIYLQNKIKKKKKSKKQRTQPDAYVISAATTK